MLIDHEIPDDPTAIYHMAICQHELKQFTQAHEALRWGQLQSLLRRSKGLTDVVIENDPGNIEAKMRLANVLEDTGKKVEALELVSEGETRLDEGVQYSHGDSHPRSGAPRQGETRACASPESRR